MKVYQAMANTFVKEGTTTLFGLLGDGQMTWWAAMAQQPNLKIVDVRDDGCAVTMRRVITWPPARSGWQAPRRGQGWRA